MVKHIREIVAACLMGFILVFGVIGGGLTFGMWPFSNGEDNTGNEKDNALLNVSTASQDALAALPDVGEAKAKAIVVYRQQHGSFKTVEEVRQVPGVEDEAFASMKDRLTVGEEEQSARNEWSTQSQAKTTEEDQ